MDLLDRLLGHDRWMTACLMTLSKDLSDAQLDQEIDIGHRTLRRTFDHMDLALDWWTGQMAGAPVPWEPRQPSVEEMLARHAASYERFDRLARELVASGRLDETFVDQHGYPQSYGATILHVILHNAQHRGEVLHILQRLGLENLPEGDPQEWEHFTGRISLEGRAPS